MFYCSDCAKQKGYSELGVKSYGECELCNKVTECNDWPTSLLNDKIICDFTVLGSLNKAAKAAIMLGREFKVDVEFIWEGMTHCITNADYITTDEVIENHRIRKENILT
jgi:hypothetical protein